MDTGRRFIVGEARDRTLFWTLVFKGDTDPNATIDTPCFLTRIQILRIYSYQWYFVRKGALFN